MRQKQPIPLKERLVWFAKDVREKAEQLRPGPDREALLDKARRADIAAHIVEWANSPGLQPPK